LGAEDVEGRLEDPGRDNPAVHVEAEATIATPNHPIAER